MTTFGEPLLLKAGVAGYEVIRSENRNRWGDYSATVADPSDPTVFWTFQEYVSAEDVWSTEITQLIVFTDRDGDGVRDEEDACPDSDPGETVVIDGCDSGVPNLAGADGYRVSDDILACAESVKNHGAFVSCAAKIGNTLRRNGAIDRWAKGLLQRCAGKARIP